MVNFLVNLYKRYSEKFQGKLFYTVILLYKYSREMGMIGALRYILKNFHSIHVYKGKKKSFAIKKLLNNCIIKTSDEVNRFLYSIDEFSTIKIKNKILGNCAIDYKYIVDGSMNELSVQGGSQFSQENNRTLEAMKSYLDRIICFVRQSSITRKDEIVERLVSMKYKSASNIEDALQRILFINQIQWQTGHILVGLGRLDKVLDRFNDDSRSDNEILAILRDFCLCLHDKFCLKSNALMGDTGQIIILGGLNEDGSYFCNRFTMLFIDAVRGIPDPKILVRVSGNTPAHIWEKLMDYMGNSTGSPLISNDDVIIPEMLEFGYSKKAAYGYTTSACWEPMPYDCYEQNNIFSINYLEPFEYISKHKDTIDSYKVFMKMYFKGLRFHIKNLITQIDKITWEKDPVLSMFSLGCRIRKKDVSEGGCDFNNYGLLTVGLQNAVKSIHVVKEVVFENQELSYAAFDKIRNDDFKGNEELRKRIIYDMPAHFGKDDEATDIDFVNKITDKTCEYMAGYTNRYDGKVKIGLSSPHYIMNSINYPASFDGRKKGEPFSVHISSDDNSQITKLINFAAALDYSNGRFNGNVVDFIIAPDIVNKNRQQFMTLVRTGFKKGVCQLQVNVLSSDILREARAHPDKFPNLIVRVWGFNAYFVQLPWEYQDYLIERAEKSERAA